MIDYADVVLGLQFGDEGKGKIVEYLSDRKNYTHCIRFSGGNNCGHTVYKNNEKFVTHSIPTGVIHGIKSIIGPGCVVNEEFFFKEMKELEDKGIRVKGLIFIAKNAHVITKEHIEEDSKDTKIGTTRRGVGPAYTSKYNRSGIRAEQVESFKPYLIDMHEEFYKKENMCRILFEGAQGFGLDVNWGDYPYVTSSGCLVADAIANGIPHRKIRDVWGVAKVYETYVGAKSFEPAEEIFKTIREKGMEYGATTGRPRQCNWLNINNLVKAINLNGVNKLVLNKIDIIREVKVWKLYDENNELVTFKNEDEFKKSITSKLGKIEIFWSESPKTL